MYRSPLLALIPVLGAFGFALAPAQEAEEPAPRALPVFEPAEDEEVPRALPVDPDEVPRALPVEPEVEEGAEGEVPVPRALPVTPEELAAEGGSEELNTEGEKEEDTPVADRPEFEPPPLPSVSRREPEPESPSVPIDASWETRTEARTLTLSVPPPRGQVTDRNGLPLAQNKVAYSMALKLPQLEGATDREVLRFAHERMRAAAGYLGKDWSLEDEVILKHYRNRRWLPLPFGDSLSSNQKEVMQERLGPGLELFPTYQRHYPESKVACHIVGYVGTKAKAPTGPVASGDPLWATTEGREGLEATFDEHLQGRAGSVNFIFNADGEKLAEELVRQPRPGRNVITSIDLEMQKLAEDCLRRYTDRGAFVIMDVQTGDIYAMASEPTYDLNTWIPYISTEEFEKLREDPDLPLFPRSFRGQYPPASTFKPAVALAALESGVVDGDTWIDCPSSVRIGNEIFRNWNKNGEGSLNVAGSLRRSCNTWYYNVGRRTGAENVSSMAHRFGFGEKTGIPLNAEMAGFMPTEANVRERYGHSFSHGYLAHASIGQGYVLSTPIQVAQMMAGIGNGYSVPKPRLVLQVQDLNNNIVEAYEPQSRNALNLTPKNLGYVRQGLIDVVNAGSGTGRSAGNYYVTMAGKTGTGEWVQKGEKLYLSWFAGYVPAEDPKYAFAAVCEGDPGQYISGGKKAAPLVGEFFNAHYKKLKGRGELEGYARTAEASSGGSRAASSGDDAPVATAVSEPEAAPAAEPERRRGIFGFGRRRR